jgi:hypothetical protein
MEVRFSSPGPPPLDRAGRGAYAVRALPDLCTLQSMEDNMKRLGIILFTGLILACGTMQPTYAQTIRSEAANHPRIAAAIRELEGAIAYMERAPHDFGGHKAAAIRDSRTALVELRAALAYRAQKDR